MTDQPTSKSMSRRLTAQKEVRSDCCRARVTVEGKVRRGRKKMEGNITISKQGYFELLVAQEKLARLEEYGVDNWEGYGFALNSGEYAFEDWVEILKRDIEDTPPTQPGKEK